MKNDQFRKWIEGRIINPSSLSLQDTTVSIKYTKMFGGRGFYAGVTISVQNAEKFSLDSKADWSEFANYDEAVLDGILTALFSQKSKLYLNGAFTLEKVEWHLIDSNGEAFFQAAKQAAREILRQNGYWD